MKKFLFLTLILAVISTTVNAQNAPDPAVMLQQAKEKQVPGLVEKAGLTTEQANKLIEINFEMKMKMMADLQGLNEADRAKKIAEFKVAKEKRYSEIPLTADQIKAVYAFYEEMGKNMQKKGN